MLTKKTILFCFILHFVASPFFCQTKKADSLRNAIKLAGEDTNKVKALLKLESELFTISNFTELTGYLYEAKDLAERINYKTGCANVYNSLGILYFNQGFYEKALKWHLLALKIRQESNDQKRILTS